MDVAKDLKEATDRRNWLDQFLQCKIWEMGNGEDKSRIKSASSQGWQALKIQMC